MSKFIRMTPSEQYVCDLFKDRYGISLTKIDDIGGKNGQEPDFEFLENGKRIFVCELKEYETLDPSEETGWETIHYPDGSIGHTRDSNAPNKISGSIHQAYKQLKKYDEPKILVFLNHYPGLDVRDLEETYRGFNKFEVDGETVVDVYYRRASEGVIKEEKNKIDLYVWIDASDKNMSMESDKFYIRTVTDSGRKLAQIYFDPSIKK